jgi:5-methylcytosine-specific restriction protein A
MTKRLEFTRKTLRQGYERAHGCCEMCGAALKKGEGTGDHIVCADEGGSNDIANLQILCNVCNKIKTATDIKRMRKAERARDKASGAMQSKSKFAKVDKPQRTGKPKLPPRQMYGASE